MENQDVQEPCHKNCTASQNRGPRVNDVVSGEFRLLKIIGSGSSGDVWMVESTLKTKVFAMKIMHSTEKSIKASHVQYISDILKLTSSTTANYFCYSIGSGEYMQRQFLLFELYGMSIRRLLNNNRAIPLPTFQSRAIVWQVCSAIAFLHSLHIAHSDIKPENVVLVDDSFVVSRDINRSGQFFDKPILRSTEIKIVDFEDSIVRPFNIHRFSGTVGYHPPETYGKSGWSYPFDVFSIGCFTFELFTGTPLLPWVSDRMEYFYCVEKCIKPLSASQARDINSVYPDTFQLGKYTSKVKSNRISARRRNKLHSFILEIKWEQRNMRQSDLKHFVSACTRVDPSARLEAREMLSHSLFTHMGKKSEQRLLD